MRTGKWVAQAKGLKWYSFATMIDFEFDPNKSAANLAKHGIDFVVAQNLWLVAGWEQPSPFLKEVRLRRTALYDGKYWTAVYTLRGPNIRLISVRRARTTEVTSYEQAVGQYPGTDLEP
jgi:uncharacterized protein